MSELNNIQKWFTSILVKPGRLDEKIALADEYYHLNSTEVVRSTEDLPARKRIWIYAGGYTQRLLECMEAEYPALHHLLGEDLFTTFAGAYLQHFPSHSPDLYDLGTNFPEFLKASQPPVRVGENIADAPYDLPVDLALVERAISEASRSKGLEANGNVLAQDPSFFMFNANVHTSPCLKLLRSGFSLAGYINSIHRGNETQLPGKKDSFIAVSRKNYSVSINELEQWQWHFLNALQRTDNYMEATAITADLNQIPKDSLLADLMLWIPSAISLGYVYPGETVSNSC